MTTIWTDIAPLQGKRTSWLSNQNPEVLLGNASSEQVVMNMSVWKGFFCGCGNNNSSSPKN